MKYLLDTCVLSDFVKGNEKTLNQITSYSPSELAISVITAMEIEYGILLISGQKAENIRSVISDLTKSISIIPLCHDIAKQAALIRADLRKQGNLIGYYDILIGATAAHHKLIMVTSNIKEFKRINHINIENWRE